MDEQKGGGTRVWEVGGQAIGGREGHLEGRIEGVNCGTPKHECLRLQRFYFYYFYPSRMSTICVLDEWVFNGRGYFRRCRN